MGQGFGEGIKLGRRAFGGAMAGLAAAAMVRPPQARAAAPDGSGAVRDMMAALEAARALSFTVEINPGASVSRDGLKTLGSRASVVFQRPDSVFAVFGGGGQADVQMLVSGGEATLYRLSLASKTVLKLEPARGAAFAVPGLFVPFLGLLSEDVERDFFGGITSLTPLAQGAPDQPETTTLVAAMAGRFTGEVWVDKTSGFPARTTGTWFGAKGDVAASAGVNLTAWSSEAPVAGAFAIKGLGTAKSVGLDGLGL